MNLNGPWKVVGNRADDVFFHVVDRDYTCFVGTSNKYRANAIAKVPEMVEVIENNTILLESLISMLPMPGRSLGGETTSKVIEAVESNRTLLAEMGVDCE